MRQLNTKEGIMNTTGRKFLAFILLIITSCKPTPEKPLLMIEGKWKVIEVKSLIEGTFNETIDEYEERIRSNNHCINSIFTIYEDSIYSNSKDCEFFSCKIDAAKFKDVYIIDNYELDEFTEDTAVSRDLVEYLSGKEVSNRNAIKVLYTDCPTGHGDFRLKIIIVDNNNIVLYAYHNAFVLSRNNIDKD